MGYAQRLKDAARMRGWALLLGGEQAWKREVLDIVEYRVAEKPFSIQTMKGLLHGGAGDVLVRFKNGDMTIIDKATWPLIVAKAPATVEKPKAQE
jgi:hypothetical protein